MVYNVTPNRNLRWLHRQTHRHRLQTGWQEVPVWEVGAVWGQRVRLTRGSADTQSPDEATVRGVLSGVRSRDRGRWACDNLMSRSDRLISNVATRGSAER